MDKKVLILEDEVLAANNIRLHLQKHQYESHIATSPERGKSLWSDHDFDIVICDINLGSDIDGIDFVTEVVKNQAAVVYLTAYSDISTLKRAEKTRPYAYVTKPYNIDQLLVTLNLAIVHSNEKASSQSAKAINDLDLTSREIEIAELLTRGHSSEKIAEILNISFNTVRTHRKNMLQKLGCNNTTELVVKYLTALRV
ncbi:response regulator transcription factor [Reichenbachiella ulvae]|uniref:DNA-binding response regulator n=1 Tax=Reichenbachiella ulvae TaxID=2980104 RepID=A0ABT3CZB5_9BACT|nr:DNA-binding response regulator [Reichenbachiella ulvae]MCV9388919.1 DNA-binding response regulator [Reichenbachiella ulvae]